MTWVTGEITSGWTSSQYYGYGILFENLPTTGESGGSPLLNDGGVNGNEVRWELLTQTGLTVDGFYEDGSFESTGIGSFTYRSFVNNSAVGDFTVFVNAAGATVTSAVSAGIPIPAAAASVDVSALISSAVSAGIPKPAALAGLAITQEGTVASIISAGIPKPIAAAAVSVQAAPIQLTVSAGIPKPTASIVMYTGEPSSYNWFEHIDDMIADGRFIVIADGSRFITFND